MSIVAALVDVSPISENLFISLWKQLAKMVASDVQLTDPL